MKTVPPAVPSEAGYYIFFVTGGSFLGFLASAHSGRHDRPAAWTFQLFLVCSWLVTIAYMFLPISGWALIVMSVPFGFFTIGNYARWACSSPSCSRPQLAPMDRAVAYELRQAAGALAVSLHRSLAQWITLAEAIGIDRPAGIRDFAVATCAPRNVASAWPPRFRKRCELNVDCVGLDRPRPLVARPARATSGGRLKVRKGG